MLLNLIKPIILIRLKLRMFSEGSDLCNKTSIALKIQL